MPEFHDPYIMKLAKKHNINPLTLSNDPKIVETGEYLDTLIGKHGLDPQSIYDYKLSDYAKNKIGGTEALRVMSANREKKRQSAIETLRELNRSSQPQETPFQYEYGNKMEPSLMAEREQYTNPKGSQQDVGGPTDIPRLNVLKPADRGEILASQRQNLSERESRARQMGEIDPSLRTNVGVPTNRLGQAPTPQEAYREGGYARKRTVDLLRQAIAQNKQGTWTESPREQLSAVQQGKSLDEINKEDTGKPLVIKSRGFTSKAGRPSKADATTVIKSRGFTSKAGRPSKADATTYKSSYDTIKKAIKVQPEIKRWKIDPRDDIPAFDNTTDPTVWKGVYQKQLDDAIVRGTNPESFARGFVQALRKQENQNPYETMMKAEPGLRKYLPKREQERFNKMQKQEEEKIKEEEKSRPFKNKEEKIDVPDYMNPNGDTRFAGVNEESDTIYFNPKTGQKIVLKDGKWQPL